jgi:hypothetical protein
LDGSKFSGSYEPEDQRPADAESLRGFFSGEQDAFGHRVNVVLWGGFLALGRECLGELGELSGQLCEVVGGGHVGGSPCAGFYG